LLGTQAQVTELDVLDVLGEVPFEDPLGTEAT
jgi:hypothetical protein